MIGQACSRFLSRIRGSEGSCCAHIVSTCCISAVLQNEQCFKLHDAFFVCMSRTIEHSHGRLNTCRFQTFCSVKITFNAILCRESTSVALLGSSIPCVDVVLVIIRGADS